MDFHSRNNSSYWLQAYCALNSGLSNIQEKYSLFLSSQWPGEVKFIIIPNILMWIDTRKSTGLLAWDHPVSKQNQELYLGTDSNSQVFNDYFSKKRSQTRNTNIWLVWMNKSIVHYTLISRELICMTPFSRVPFSSSELISLRLQTANPAVDQGLEYRRMMGMEIRKEAKAKMCRSWWQANTSNCFLMQKVGIWAPFKPA